MLETTCHLQGCCLIIIRVGSALSYVKFSQYKVECETFNVMSCEPWVALDKEIINVMCGMMSSATSFVYID